jgi:protein-S-isoprenylcysteine O-methyltransferase Ste14
MKLRRRTAGSTDKVGSRESTGTMIPARSRRSRIESVFMRVIATAGIVALGVAAAAIMADNDVQGWIIGLAVSTVSVVLAAVLWSARYV